MYFSAFELFFLGQLKCNFDMAAAANHENNQTSSRGYRKTKRYPKKWQVYLWTSIFTLKLHYSYWVFSPRTVFSAVSLGYQLCY